MPTSVRIRGLRRPRWPAGVACALALLGGAAALDNGVALLPPMGWSTWPTFGCEVDCARHPKTCINENLIMEMAEVVATDGYRDAGYSYMILDDCWMAKTRGESGALEPDPARFPDGMRMLDAFLAKRKLGFGLYADVGSHTCKRYPGSRGHFEQDAETFASWGVDYLKLDGCFEAPSELGHLYVEFGGHLNRTNHAILYACAWPAFLPDPVATGFEVPYGLLASTCNTWNNWQDMTPSWKSIKSTIRHWALASASSSAFTNIARPGGWNDPNQIVIGAASLSVGQARVQMGMWAMFAAPLIVSADLRSISTEMKDILLNPNVIAINQDRLGQQARFLRAAHNTGAANFTLGHHVWEKQLENGDVAVAVLNLSAKTAHICIPIQMLELDTTSKPVAHDVFADRDVGEVWHRLCAAVPGEDISMLRLSLTGGSRNPTRRLALPEFRAAIQVYYATLAAVSVCLSLIVVLFALQRRARAEARRQSAILKTGSSSFPKIGSGKGGSVKATSGASDTGSRTHGHDA